MAISTKVKDSGTWKTLERAWVKESGTWKKIHLISINDNGTWKTVHRNAISQYAIVSTSDVIDYGVGAYTYTVEQGVRFLKFEMQGGSGGGSGSIGVSWHTGIYSLTHAGQNGASGGASATRTTIFEVVPGETYSITVGGAGGGGGGVLINARWGLGGNNVSWTYNGTGSALYDSAISSVFSSGTGGNGGASRVTSGSRGIDIIAAGGTGAGAPSGQVQQNRYYSNSAGGTVYNGSVSWSAGSNGSLGSSSTAGTEPRNLNNESASNITTSSGSNVSGGGAGTIPYPFTNPGSGSSGTNGYVKMSKYR